VTTVSGEAAGRDIFLSQAVQGADAARLTPDRLRAEAERRISAPEG
jgi:hypothetical protein